MIIYPKSKLTISEKQTEQSNSVRTLVALSFENTKLQVRKIATIIKRES